MCIASLYRLQSYYVVCAMYLHLRVRDLHTKQMIFNTDGLKYMKFNDMMRIIITELTK